MDIDKVVEAAAKALAVSELVRQAVHKAAPAVVNFVDEFVDGFQDSVNKRVADLREHDAQATKDSWSDVVDRVFTNDSNHKAPTRAEKLAVVAEYYDKDPKSDEYASLSEEAIDLAYEHVTERNAQKYVREQFKNRRDNGPDEGPVPARV